MLTMIIQQRKSQGKKDKEMLQLIKTNQRTISKIGHLVVVLKPEFKSRNHVHVL